MGHWIPRSEQIYRNIEHESCLFLKDLHVTTFRSNFVPLTGPGF